jgi:hypothetical protein
MVLSSNGLLYGTTANGTSIFYSFNPILPPIVTDTPVLPLWGYLVLAAFLFLIAMKGLVTPRQPV